MFLTTFFTIEKGIMSIFKRCNLAGFFVLFFITIQMAYADTSYLIKRSDTLDSIVNKFYKDSNLSKQQIYIAILAENPTAFNLGNINYLKSGQSLSLPKSDKLFAMEAIDAKNLVSQHYAYAKQGKRIRIAPPFADYVPQSHLNISSDISELADKQQQASDKLQKLDSESEQLRLRLEQLEADKKAMDEELQILNNLIAE